MWRPSVCTFSSEVNASVGVWVLATFSGFLPLSRDENKKLMEDFRSSAGLNGRVDGSLFLCVQWTCPGCNSFYLQLVKGSITSTTFSAGEAVMEKLWLHSGGNRKSYLVVVGWGTLWCGKINENILSVTRSAPLQKPDNDHPYCDVQEGENDLDFFTFPAGKKIQIELSKEMWD